ncbi:MAG: carbohydrate ABC transporter permease [Deinococcales bacterium]
MIQPLPQGAKREHAERVFSSIKLRDNLFLWVVMGLISFLWLYPIFWVLTAAFKDNAEVFTAGANLIPQNPVGFDNFVRAWRVANFSQYFGNSVFYGIGAVVVAVVRSILAGYVLARYNFPGKWMFIGLVTATGFIPVEGSIIPEFQLVNWFDKNLFPILNTPYVVPIVQGAQSSLWVLLYMGAFRAIPNEMFEAAEVDGANFWQKFTLSLPLVLPVTVTVVIFQFIRSWEDVLTPIIYVQSNPALRNLQSGLLAFRGENATDWVGLSAAIVIAILPVIVLFLAMQRFFVNAIAGSVKG